MKSLKLRQRQWEGETLSVCGKCGSVFRHEAIISRAAKSDERWLLGAPESIGEYWVIFNSDLKLPVRAEIFIHENKEVLRIEGKDYPLPQIAREILYHHTFVLPDIPAALKDK